MNDEEITMSHPRIPSAETIARRKKLRNKFNNVLGILVTTGFPCGAFMSIGYYWSDMSSGLASASIISAVIASFGVLIATVVIAEWGDDKK